MRKILCLWCILSLLMMKTEYVMAQGVRIGGVVVDEDNFPLPGASVRVRNMSSGTVTDVDGKFSLSNVSVGEVLVISFIGKKTVEVPAKEGVRVKLYGLSEELREAVVQVAYGVSWRTAVTGAVSTTGSGEIARRPVTSVTSALEGVMAGVQVNNTYGQPGSSPAIRVRGFGSVNGVNDPLYVVDGVPYAGELAELNPDDVESISVLKDAASAALYGNRAANGVILITMKKARSERLRLEASVKQGIYSRGIAEYDCIGSDDFMEVMWKSYRNSLLTTNPGNYPTLEKANAEATASLVSNILGYNIYNMPDNQLFDAEGHLVGGAAVRDGIRGI